MEKQPEIIKMNVHVITKDNTAALELRRTIVEKDLLQAILQSIYHHKPLVILPVFSDPVRSWGALIEKNVVKRDEQGVYWYVS